MPPAWWGLRYEPRRAQCVSLEQASPYASRVPRLRRRRVIDRGSNVPRRMPCRSSCSPVLVQELPGTVEATRAASSREPSPDRSNLVVVFSPRRAPAERARLQVSARIAPARLDLPSPQPAATPWSDLGAQARGFPVGMDLDDAVQQACRGNVRAAFPVSPAVVAAWPTRHPIRPAAGRGDLLAVLGISPTRPVPLPVDGVYRLRASPDHAQPLRLRIWHSV